MGRLPRHGGFSLVAKDQLVKDQPHIRKYLEETRVGLVRDVAGAEEALSEMQRVVIDRIISRLAICRLIESYIEKFGPFRRDKSGQNKALELEPALGNNYLAFSNAIDRSLVALGLDRRVLGDAIDLKQYARETYGPKEKEAVNNE